MPELAPADPGDVAERLRVCGAEVPEVWLERLLERRPPALSPAPRRPAPLGTRQVAGADRMAEASAELRWILAGHPRWLIRPGQPNPLGGAVASPGVWALLVFSGLLAACGGRAASARGRALAFELACGVAPLPVRGSVFRRPALDAIQRSRWVREALRRWRGRDAAAACLHALEASGALAATPAAVEQARWRLGPGSDASDAEAIRRLVADVLWHCEDDASLLLCDLARRAVTSSTHAGAPRRVESIRDGGPR